MSIHTILSQMEEEFDNLFLAGDKGKTSWVSENLLKLCSVFVGYSTIHGSTNQTFGNKEAQMIKPYTDEIKKFMRSFATRIVEEVGKELIDEWKIQSSEEFWGRFDEYKLITEFSQKLMQRVLQTIEQRTKLQKMKG